MKCYPCLEKNKNEHEICEYEVEHYLCNHNTQNNDLLPVIQYEAKQTQPILKMTANFNGKCNMQCPSCNVWKLPNGLYTEENFWGPARHELFPQLRQIEMLSGEPFIQTDTFKLMDEMLAINPACEWNITTNMFWNLTPKIKDYLGRLKIKKTSR